MKAKTITRLLFCAVFSAISLIGTASAVSVGEKIGSCLMTDIQAEINLYDIESFNIDGNTVIIAEDLAYYGFDVTWNAAERALYITRHEKPRVISTYDAPQLSESVIGLKSYDVLHTDIKVYLEGSLITSYNIQGYTAIDFEALGIYGKVSFDNAYRMLRLRTDDGSDYKLGIPTVDAIDKDLGYKTGLTEPFFFIADAKNDIYPVVFMKNNTNKRIGYYEIHYTMYDPLGFMMKDEITGKGSVFTKHNVTVDPGEYLGDSMNEKAPVARCGDLAYLKVFAVNIVYSDGKRECIFIDDYIGRKYDKPQA